MSEKHSHHIASVIKPPAGEIIVNDSEITRSYREKKFGAIVLGYVSGEQASTKPDKNGIAYVVMNSSEKMSLDKDQNGLIATNSLAGCTGVAGFARRNDGSIATFISHYDTISQLGSWTGKTSPVNKDLYRFQNMECGQEQDLATPIFYLVAYEKDEHSKPHYGKRVGYAKDWSYLDQIINTATQLDENAHVLLLPYSINQHGHTLASGRINNTEGIFWDGVQVDFDAYLANVNKN